ncbi:hypothetical protein OHU45_37405 [Streptomyces tubercidicus]|uniref:hypothetical protein n=1 Tax=Streptomyces tubercidicus TaxID=47759 RepID=UPI0030DDE3FE
MAQDDSRIRRWWVHWPVIGVRVRREERYARTASRRPALRAVLEDVLLPYSWPELGLVRLLRDLVEFGAGRAAGADGVVPAVAVNACPARPGMLPTVHLSPAPYLWRQ